MADDYGTCQCGANTVHVGGNCVEAVVFVIVGLIVGFLLLALVTCVYIQHKNAINDEVWQVHPDELLLSDEIIGQGSFGVVLLAVRGHNCLFNLWDRRNGVISHIMNVFFNARIGIPGNKGSHQACSSIQQEQEGNTEVSISSFHGTGSSFQNVVSRSQQ